MTTIDNLTICYQGIQRVYRNAVVAKLRDTFASAYGTDASDEVKKPFKREWGSIRDAAEERRKTGEVSSLLTDEFDLLGVNHFYNLFDAHYEVLFPSTSARPPKERSQAKQALLGWAKTVKNFRDPLSHPGEMDFDDDDSINMLYCAKKVLDSLQLSEAARQLFELQRKINSQTPVGVSLAYLPPADEVVSHFVGRARETKQLDNWIGDLTNRRWALSGDGGKGKSAIAYHFAKQIAFDRPEGIEAVVWLSAKKRRFVHGQTVSVDRPDFHDLSSSIDRILAAFGEDTNASLDLPQKKAKVLELLKVFPALLVVDDIDTLEGNEIEASQFLIMDIPAQTQSRVLVTSRRVLFGLENVTTQVTGLSEQDTADFVASRCDEMRLPRESVLKQLKAIREVTDASPLFIDDLLRLTLTGLGVPRAIGLWRDKRGAAAREYAIKREFEKLPDNAKEVLFTLSLMDRSCTHDELMLALDWHVDRLVDALQTLRQMFLMPNVSQRDGVERLTLNNNTRSLILKVFEGSTSFNKAKRTVQAVISTLRTCRLEEDAVDRAKRRVFTMLSSFAPDEQFRQAENELKALEQKYSGRSDIYSTLGWVYKREGRKTDAREMFKRAVELKCKSQEVYWHWADLEASDSEWNESLRVAELGLQDFPGHHDLSYCVGSAQHRIGRDLIHTGYEAKGRELCVAAEQNLKKFLTSASRRTTLQTSRAYRALVLNAEALTDGKSINRYLIRWRQECGTVGNWQSELDRLRLKFPGDVQRASEMPQLPISG